MNFFHIVDFNIISYYYDTFAISEDFVIVKTAPHSKGIDIGQFFGTPPFKEVTNIKNQTVSIFGYPWDKISSTELIPQWGMFGTIFDEVSSVLLYHSPDNQVHLY
ncbi:hypothetical protein [Alkalihalobacillus pseudalcaliphilus]|uniref:hypothetical protein n=1 Tax=Alkalihalobacillus pseudalcaliphilus TaxID=79884 RepID=UPI00064DE56F|nr:hypothetical protein [Alkalihalobacillus pseudalcaliphilus]KMK76551.1 hypothetical protein AB990_15385 [Alkalihalobacillus pseudalcaliphilus]